MARADRLERMENLRLDLETEYRAALIAALEAAPRGLLDPSQDKATLAKVTPVLEALEEQADAIDELRDKLGLEEFALHRDFLARRKPAKAHEVGEAKQIRAWLEQLKAEDSSSRT
jgi:methylphosphotriester-DNA--protein-cysteine methyltransferase